MKKEEKKKAIELRITKGLSIIQIANILKVSKGAVSLWVRDVPLTKEQREILYENSRTKNTYDARHAGAIVNKEKFSKLRDTWVEEGKIKARDKNYLHLIGCMLYWCEGTRKNNNNRVTFTNANPNMMKLFVTFLRDIFKVDKEKIIVTLKHYDDIVSLKDAESYWLDILGLNSKSLRKSTLNYYIDHVGKINSKLKYGTCKITVYRTDIIQHIYGAISEYSKIFGGHIPEIPFAV